jgi:signal transduction histidine kinase
MFGRARRRLTVLYIALFALVLGIFTIVFIAALAVTLAPAFDIAPELSNEQAADLAYRQTIERIGIALVVGDVAVLAFVGVAAWVLAARTLEPIREVHNRQRRFVADASHEMRSPLAAIRSTADAALSGPGDAAAVREALQVVQRESERLTRISSDLLLLARSDDGQLQPRMEQFDLSVLVADAVEEHHNAEAGQNAVAQLLPDLPVRGDPEEVKRVILNLLDNAYRYGGDRVQVAVRTRATEREAIVEVADSGPGIAHADMERIFEPFYRVRSDASAPPGSGLGLAIAASLARASGGRLAVDSRIGQGTTFRLSLPRFR